MSIRVVCPNGHVLKVKDDFAGKTGLCPTCKARVKVPEPAQKELSEDAILNILGPYVGSGDGRGRQEGGAGSADIRPGDSRRNAPPKKICYKCNQQILVGTHICPHCHTYIAKLTDF